MDSARKAEIRARLAGKYAGWLAAAPTDIADLLAALEEEERKLARVEALFDVDCDTLRDLCADYDNNGDLFADIEAAFHAALAAEKGGDDA
jgi:predicted nucleic acid-binding protein